MKRGGYTHCAGCGGAFGAGTHRGWKHVECLGKPNAFCAKCGGDIVGPPDRTFVHTGCLVRVPR